MSEANLFWEVYASAQFVNIASNVALEERASTHVHYDEFKTFGIKLKQRPS